MLFKKSSEGRIGIQEVLFFLTKFVVLIFVGCQSRVSENQIVARAGDSVLDREAMHQRMTWEGMRPEQESEFVDRWVNRELLFQEAKRLGLDKALELRWELELVEKEYLIQKLLERTFAKGVQVTDAEIAAYYEKNKELFRVDEDEIRALHILTKARREADIASQEIRAGKPFEKVAEERSVGIFRGMGGDMGFFNRGDVIPEVARLAFRLSEGRVSNIFQSNHGYHILKVLKKRKRGDIKELSEVRDEIFQHLRVSKERSVYYDLLYQLQNETKVYVSVPQSKEGHEDTLRVQAEH